MAYTRHGHHIPGTTALSVVERPQNVARCGGTTVCHQCMSDATRYLNAESNRLEQQMASEQSPGVVPQNTSDNYDAKAMQLVRDVLDKTLIDHNPGDELPAYSLYVVWRVKVLQHWKALVATDMPDGRYFEVTYDGDKKQAYVDWYHKYKNIVVPDEGSSQ